MKIIRFECKNGAVWGLPLSVVAEDRAKYYAEKDKDTTYQEEYDFVMRDDYEGRDWFLNNMNAKDVRAHFTEISPPPKLTLDETLEEAERWRLMCVRKDNVLADIANMTAPYQTLDRLNAAREAVKPPEDML